MSRAAQVARERNIPIVLDPVGAGATGPRLEASQKLLEEARPWLVKGNASEIMALSGASGQKQKGVDSEIETDSNERFWEVALEAKKFSATHKVLVGVTGKTDLLTDGEKGIAIEGGSILLTKLTGTGCLLSALCGAFMAVGPQEPLDAANAAFSLVSRSGERAAASLSRPGAMGEFKARFFDELSLSYKGTDSR
jgi:hydroxyethylthiazole kinase